MRQVWCCLGLLMSISASAEVYSYSAPPSDYEFPTMTTVSVPSDGGGATTVTTSSAVNSSVSTVSSAQTQLVPLVLPPKLPPGPPTGTAILGQLVGAVTANKAANSTGNIAAINATQSNLINTEAAVMSTSVTSVLNQLAKSHS